MAGKRMADSGDLGYTPPADRHRVARPRHGYKERPLGPSDEDRLRWQRFLAELPARIAQIRAEEADLLCPSCGSTTPPEPVFWKRCYACDRVREASSFSRNRTRKDGLSSACRDCHARLAKTWRARKALEVAS